MRKIQNILVVQTAFIGDVILTLPLLQVLKEYFAFSNIDVVVIPRAAELLINHPAISNVIVYDKRGADSGVAGFMKMVKRLRERSYDLAILPHRSLRSAALVLASGIPIRVGFKKGVARFIHSHTVSYNPDIHEIERNISLLSGIGVEHHARMLPDLYPGELQKKKVTDLLHGLQLQGTVGMIAVAPGTVWNTKRWLKERFAMLAKELVKEGFHVMLLGGREDEGLCEEIRMKSEVVGVYNTAGKLSLLESAELLRRCRALVCNDSAPMHLAVAVRTPVVAIFGATIPEFGFAPYGENDVVVETRGLPCRPCSIHGGEKCPIKTFDCMERITHERVMVKLMGVLEKVQK